MARSNTTELPDRYDHAETEAATYRRWREAGAFSAPAASSTRAGGSEEPFTVLMPPPNVTAVLHVGHGLNNTVQDVITRWARMQAGTEALWVPGTDHAGIATQNVVEKQLTAEGKSRFDLGREAFVRRTEQFVEQTGGVILKQLEALGCSADWTRTAYTFSPELSRGVREAFVRLFDKGLIYRGHRVIHWCPRCLTSLSDEEAEFQEEPGTLWHVAYPVSDDPTRRLTVATTRPETMLGDVAVAVNPADDRYRDLVGRSVRLPIVDRDIPVIADEYADPAFGTGVVKITPAHDPNDFEVGRRHHLAMPVVIDETAHVNAGADAEGRVPEWLAGLDRFEARKRIVAALTESGALVRTEQHTHNVRHCYRCGTVVEPRLSDQWFVKMEPLARPALQAVRDGAIRILPERWEAVYVNWLEGIRDWNISRQLWWGHRVPVWYCDACSPVRVLASREDLTTCPECGGRLRQDEDVLDTWFSSWLWPISTLGWPADEAPDLQAFYPTDVLATAPEILFFWVARMIMAGYEFQGRAPFHTVLLHGTVRDTSHRKMSKSLGNGIDPMDVIRMYGADALRWTLVSGMGLGADVILDPNDLERSFATGRNFATKLWNIARFLLGNLGDAPVPALATLDARRLSRADAWILARLDTAIAECNAALGPLRPTHPLPGVDQRGWRPEQRYQGMRLNEYAETARRFVWSELADWYVEAVKGRLGEAGDDGMAARAVLVHAFDSALRLLHPIVPFITEAIWQRLPSRPDGALLTQAAWPTVAATGPAPAAAAAEFEVVMEAVSQLRQIRSDYAIPPARTLDATIVPADAGARADVFEDERGVLERLARVSFTLAGHPPTGAVASAFLRDGTEVCLHLAGAIDVEHECARLRAELAELERQMGALEARLANEKFTSRAPAAVVQGERDKLVEWTARRRQLTEKVEALCGG
jgi:valyl-tRNA synthetase